VDGDRDVTVRLDTDAPVVHIAALENVTEGSGTGRCKGDAFGEYS